ncbi:MAG: restriction endonuclease subunit S [Bacilli bacterium]|nr:restriction endonuclease subunit S [Bacilli bacterium]
MMNVPKLRFKEFTDEWQHDKICNVTTYVDYRGKTPNKTETGIFLVTAKNVKKGYIDYDCSKEYVAEIEYEEIMHRGKPKVGDVLITTEAPCGNVAQIDKENIALAQRVIKYRGNALIDNTFLKYEFLSNYFQNELKKVTSGGTVSGVKGSILHNMEIHYCSKEEQLMLSSFLTLLDKKIELQTKKIEDLKLYKLCLKNRVFNESGMLRYKLNNLCCCKASNINLLDIEFDNGKFPIYGATGEIKKISTFQFSDNYIAIVKDGASVGKNIICDGNSSIIATMSAIIPNKIPIYYFNELIENINFSKYIVGSGIPHIYFKDYSTETVKIHNRPRMKLIDSIFYDLSRKITYEEDKLKKLFQLKKGLMQNMFV